MLGKLDEDEAYSSSGSDYEVECFVHPTKVRKLVNDETADLLGNFDDAKRKEIMDGTYNETHRSSSEMENSDSDADVRSDDEEALAAVQHKYMKIEDEVAQTSANSDNGDDAEAGDNSNDDSHKEVNTNLTKDQLSSLLRGTAKANRHVLYVTNLNFETTKADLEEYFGRVGVVKSVRIPKKRRGGFAFVEMADLDGFQRGFELHNTELHTRKIKVQLSEAGKKKSANKKNIIKQKNRKLAEMRNEQKTFTKSGKFYDKTLKKEKAKEMLARKRWRKKPSSGPKPA